MIDKAFLCCRMSVLVICFMCFVLIQGLVPPSKMATTYATTRLYAGQVPLVPYVPDKSRPQEYMWMDIYNALGRDRTLFVSRYLDDEACNQLVASLVWLNSQNNNPITMYLNVPGAMVRPTMAVFDVMRKLTCPIVTINTGLTVGVSTLLCAAGSSGKRLALPNSRFLMAKAGLDDAVQGQAQHIALQIKEVMKGNERYIEELARLCGHPAMKITQDMKRDFYLTATEAVAYGVIDKVQKPAQPVKIMKYRGSDDDAVRYGHFCESRKLKESFDDVVAPPKQDFDDYALSEMDKQVKKGRIDPRSLRNGGGVNRFANSRCKPPGANKPFVPPGGEGGGGGADELFKNTGF